MPVLVDSHCHLDKLDYDKLHTGIDDVLNKAKERGVEYFLSVGVTLAAFPKMMEMKITICKIDETIKKLLFNLGVYTSLYRMRNNK